MVTPGWIGRDLQIFPDILSAIRLPDWYSENAKESAFEIMYPLDFVPEDSPEQVQAMEEFIEDIVNSTGCNYRKVSIKDDWKMTAPVEEKNLKKYLYNVSCQ